MLNHTHAQKQHGTEHGQTDRRKNTGKRSQRTAGSCLANITEFDVAIFGRRSVRVLTGIAENPSEIIVNKTAAVH